MTTTQAEPRLCACGCGQEVIGSRAAPGEPAWKRGHKLKAARGKLTPLPGPADDLDGEDLDAGEALPDDLEDQPDDDLELPDWLTSGQDGPPAPPEPELTADRPPGRLAEKPAKGSGKGKTRATATVRKDVHAKIRMVLYPAGQAWQFRDQPCGGTFVQQEPEISAALAEIVCDSPDLLGWFTGPVGGYMKWFRLFMACLPVGNVVWAHHVAHGLVVPAGDPLQPPQQEAFAA